MMEYHIFNTFDLHNYNNVFSIYQFNYIILIKYHTNLSKTNTTPLLELYNIHR